MKQLLYNNRFWIIIVTLIYLTILFLHIESYPLRKFDEARNAINALEMHLTGFSIVTTCEYSPDHWNTKPPLLIWIQTLGLKLFGIREFSIRLVSILAGLGFIPLFLGLRKILGVKFIEAISALTIFISLPIIVKSHGFKTGDYDALLTLFMSMYTLFFYAFLKSKHKKYLFLFFISLFLATMTKGIAALLFLPGIFIYIIISKDIKWLMSMKSNIYIYAISFITLTVSYYLIRDNYDPNYINHVLENELGGRFLEVNENHTEKWNFYFKNLALNNLGAWSLFLFLVPVFIYEKAKKNKFLLYLSILIIFQLLIVSSSQTKLYWYSLPIFPLLSIILGTLIVSLFNNSKLKNLIAFLFIYPLYQQIDTVSKNINFQDSPHDYYNISFISNNEDFLSDYEKVYLLEPDYFQHTRFYTESSLNSSNDKKFEFALIKRLDINDIVIVSDHKTKDTLNELYNIELIKSENPVFVFKVLGKN